MRTPNLTVVPRTAVDLTLRTARLPLRTLAAVTRKDPGAWTPTLAFDAIDASVRQLAGGLLHDDALVASGRREQLRVQRLGEAVEAKERAASVRAEADERLDEERGEAERRRDEADRRAAEAQDRVEAERSESERRVEAADRRRRAKAGDVEQAEERAVAGRRRAARSASVEAEERELAAQAEAAREEAGVLALDEQLEKSRRRRRAATA